MLVLRPLSLACRWLSSAFTWPSLWVHISCYTDTSHTGLEPTLKMLFECNHLFIDFISKHYILWYWGLGLKHKSLCVCVGGGVGGRGAQFSP